MRHDRGEEAGTSGAGRGTSTTDAPTAENEIGRSELECLQHIGILSDAFGRHAVDVADPLPVYGNEINALSEKPKALP